MVKLTRMERGHLVLPISNIGTHLTECNPGHTNHRAWVGLLSPYASYALWARDSCKTSVRNTQAHNCGMVFLPCVTGYWHPVEAGPCQEGYYCPNGTLLPIPCPDNTMKNYTGGYGHVSDCTACYAGKVCVNGKSPQKFTWLLICRCILEGGVNVQCERIFNNVYRLYRLQDLFMGEKLEKQKLWFALEELCHYVGFNFCPLQHKMARMEKHWDLKKSGLGAD